MVFHSLFLHAPDISLWKRVPSMVFHLNKSESCFINSICDKPTWNLPSCSWEKVENVKKFTDRQTNMDIQQPNNKLLKRTSSWFQIVNNNTINHLKVINLSFHLFILGECFLQTIFSVEIWILPLVYVATRDRETALKPDFSML